VIVTDQEARPSKPRLALFAFGDFAFNLYWQSALLYLLFYYTEALGLGVERAAALYLAASIWDGIANFAVGALVDRYGDGRRCRIAIMVGAVPLGLSFVLAYAPPPVTGGWASLFILAGHLLFRTAYAAVNVPYLALSARVSPDSRDRAFVAGLRMLAGTAAAVTVALGTGWLGTWLLGAGPRAYFGAALLFAGLATAILLAVGGTTRLAVREPAPGDRPSIARCLVSLARNRAFVTLSAAMMAMIAATTILNKSVLYYFKYVFGSEGAGQVALAAMLAVSAAAVPVWMTLAHATGTQRAWFVAIGLCVAALAGFAIIGIDRIAPMQGFLIFMQAATVGLHFAYWALLPDTIDYGERTTGVRVEGIVFGLAALLQRVAIGLATAILGLSFGKAGYVANVAQSAETLADIRWTVALVPLGFFLLSGVVMAFNPLRAGE
jgi:GPH family glycoside/pentoside/hexuronide:cation symporter